MKINTISLTEIKKYVYLDPNYDLRWVFTDCSRQKDELAGCIRKPHTKRSNRYSSISINYKTYKLHHILYQIYNNVENIPEGLIVDHIDGNTFNNSKMNLRLASLSDNSRNRKKPRTNTSGYKGVTKGNDGKYRVRVTTDNGRITIGYFEDIEKAAQAYTQAAQLHYGEFFRSE